MLVSVTNLLLQICETVAAPQPGKPGFFIYRIKTRVISIACVALQRFSLRQFVYHIGFCLLSSSVKIYDRYSRFRLAALAISIRNERDLRGEGGEEFGKANRALLTIAHILFYVSTILGYLALCQMDTASDQARASCV